MTDYAKTKLNKAMKELLVVKTERKELKEREDDLVEVVKTAMTEAHLDTWTTTGVKATISTSARMSLDKDKVAQFLKDKFGIEEIPSDLFTLKECVTLNVRAVKVA